MTNYAKHETDEVAAIVRECFSYDAESGDVIRIAADIRHKKLIGKSACVPIEDVWGMKYLKISVKHRQYMAHRICWLLHYGEWPSMLIDHDDGDGRNNRISNLREADNQKNAMNSKKRNPRSGHTGVRWHKQGKMWNARIAVNGKEIGLGLFSNIDDAVNARKEAEEKYGFHPNHGKTR